jgi:hypothetical protein
MPFFSVGDDLAAGPLALQIAGMAGVLYAIQNHFAAPRRTVS